MTAVKSGIDQIKTIHDLATLKMNGKPVGKEFLRWRGNSESGELLSLKMDLKNPDQMAIVDEYFAAKRARK